MLAVLAYVGVAVQAYGVAVQAYVGLHPPLAASTMHVLRLPHAADRLGILLHQKNHQQIGRYIYGFEGQRHLLRPPAVGGYQA